MKRNDDAPVHRGEVREYRKTATVLAGQAPTGGTIPTLEGDHTYEAGDYIAGPGQAGEFWPVKRSIFEATYEPIDAARLSYDRGADAIRELLDESNLWEQDSEGGILTVFDGNKDVLAALLAKSLSVPAPTLPALDPKVVALINLVDSGDWRGSAGGTLYVKPDEVVIGVETLRAVREALRDAV